MNRLSKLLAIVIFSAWLFSPALSLSQPTNTTVLDSFDGTEQPASTNWAGGIEGASGQCDIVSGVLTSSGTGDETCYYDVATFGPNLEMVFAMPDATSQTLDSTWRSFFCIDSNVGSTSVASYGLRIRPVTGSNNDVLQFFRMTNGLLTFGNIGSSYAAIDFSNDMKLGVVLDSANYPTSVNMKLFIDTGGGWGSAVIDHTESTNVFDCTNSYFGFQILLTSQKVDNLVGGNPSSGSSNLLMLTPIMFQ